MRSRSRFFFVAGLMTLLYVGALVQFNEVRIRRYSQAAARLLGRVAQVDADFMKQSDARMSCVALAELLEGRAKALEALRGELEAEWCPPAMHDIAAHLDEGISQQRQVYERLASWVRTAAPPPDSQAEMPVETDESDLRTPEDLLADTANEHYAQACKRLLIQPVAAARLPGSVLTACPDLGQKWAAKRAWREQTIEFTTGLSAVLGEFAAVRKTMQITAGRIRREKINDAVLAAMRDNAGERYKLVEKIAALPTPQSASALSREARGIIETSIDLCWTWLTYAGQKQAVERYEADWGDVSADVAYYLFYITPPPPPPDEGLRARAIAGGRRLTAQVEKLDRSLALIREACGKDPDLTPLAIPWHGAKPANPKSKTQKI